MIPTKVTGTPPQILTERIHTCTFVTLNPVVNPSKERSFNRDSVTCKDEERPPLTERFPKTFDKTKTNRFDLSLYICFIFYVLLYFRQLTRISEPQKSKKRITTKHNFKFPQVYKSQGN